MSSLFEEKPFQRRPFWLAAFMILPLVMAFMAPQAANAGGGDVAIEMIAVQAERQEVDTDGDGRLDIFSADFVVNADGTATGTLYKGFSFRVEIKGGTITVEPSGDILVTVQGVDEHEVGHTLGFRHEHTPPASGGSEGGGIITIDDYVDWKATTTTGHVNTFSTYVHLSIH